jgi:uncharacterized integral membrane protein
METEILGTALTALVIACVAFVRTLDGRDHRPRPVHPLDGRVGSRPGAASDTTPGPGGPSGVAARRFGPIVGSSAHEDRKARGGWQALAEAVLGADRIRQVVPPTCFLMALAILVVTFAVQNSHAVTVRILFWQIAQVPLAAAIVVPAALAVALAVAVGRIARRDLIPGLEPLRSHLASSEATRHDARGLRIVRRPGDGPPARGRVGPSTARALDRR